MMNQKPSLKVVFLSVLIIFHLVVIVVMANGHSYLGRRWQTYLVPYANFLGMNTTWNFFSPEPASVMYFKYRLDYDSGKESEEKFFPEEGAAPVSDIRKRRWQFLARSMLMETRRINQLFIPWLCRQNPEASSIFLENIVQMIPPLDRAVTFSEADITGLSQKFETIHQSFSCRGSPDEEGL